MTRIARVLFGFRDDLDLSQRWWHRLLKVLTVVLFIAAGTVGVLFLGAESHEPPLSDVRVIETLRGFTKKSSADIANTIPAFLDSPGQLGGIKDGRVVLVNSYLLEKDFCSFDMVKHASAFADSINAGENDRAKHVTAEQATKFLRDEMAGRKPGEEKRYCMLRSGVGVDSASVVKYEYTVAGTLKVWAAISAKIAVALGGVLFALLNLYYRGVVYVVCGPRGKRPASKAAPV